MKCPAREIMFQQKSRYLGDKWGGRWHIITYSAQREEEFNA